MLTPLQERLLALIGQLPEAEGFVLAGGAALIHERHRRPAHGRPRPVHDGPRAVESLAGSIERASAAAGLSCRRERDGGTFVRLVITDGDEAGQLDIAYDVRIRPAETGPGIATLAFKELAADKVLALFAAPRPATSSTSPRSST